MGQPGPPAPTDALLCAHCVARDYGDDIRYQAALTPAGRDRLRQARAAAPGTYQCQSCGANFGLYPED